MNFGLCDQCFSNPGWYAKQQPPVPEGRIRMRRMAFFDECSDCYKKIELSNEQVCLKLKLLETAINIIKQMDKE